MTAELTSYCAATGKILCVMTIQDGDLEHVKDPYILGHPPNNNCFVDNGEFIDFGEPPSDNFYFDVAERKWIDATSEASIRYKRGCLLAGSDWTDTASAPNRLGNETYGQWQEYRQALRDITKQRGFPFGVEWPTPPIA